MSTASAARSVIASTEEIGDDARREHVVASYECNRLGLTASAPYFSLGDVVRLVVRRLGLSAG